MVSIYRKRNVGFTVFVRAPVLCAMVSQARTDGKTFILGRPPQVGNQAGGELLHAADIRHTNKQHFT